MKAAIAVRNLTKIYSEGPVSVKALSNVNLDVQGGEVTLLMGPSGSGKTTLISIMGCILRPTSGSVCIRGRLVSDCGEKELPRVRLDHIGFIFQGFNLFYTLTAGENVELTLDLKNIRGQAARSSGWRSPALWPASPMSFSPTSPRQRLTPRAGVR